MRYGIISDIHGNLEALDAVLGELERARVDRYLCIGDIVGYGADPKECIEAVKAIGPEIAIAGNHEWGVLGLLDLEYFNEYASAAVTWTKKILEKEELDYLMSFKLSGSTGDITLVHGSLNEPSRFNYIFDTNDAYATMKLCKTPLCFVGHTHAPGIFYADEKKVARSPGFSVTLDRSKKYLIDAGSIGQPRDGDPRASFAIYDTEAGGVEIRRVAYNIEQAQEKILRAGLPAELASRLARGR